MKKLILLKKLILEVDFGGKYQVVDVMLSMTLRGGER